MKKLSLIEKAFFLKQTLLFNDLDLDLLIAIAEKIHQDIYDQNEKIFDINQLANKMFFIAKGNVNIINENSKILKTLKINDFFGDESIFNEKPRGYLAICTQDSLILSLTKTNLYNIISECPSVAVALLNCYAKQTKHRY